jgi:hypothetical protein
LLSLNFPSGSTEIPNPRSKPQADAMVDGVKVVDLPVALEDFDDARAIIKKKARSTKRWKKKAERDPEVSFDWVERPR